MSLRTILTPGAQDLPWTELYASSITLGTGGSAKQIVSFVKQTAGLTPILTDTNTQVTGWIADATTDPNSLYSASAGGFVIPADLAGIYKFDGAVSVTDGHPTSGTFREMFVQVENASGSVIQRVYAYFPTSSMTPPTSSVYQSSAVLNLLAGYKVKLYVAQDSGSSLSIDSSSGTDVLNHMSIIKIA